MRRFYKQTKLAEIFKAEPVDLTARLVTLQPDYPPESDPPDAPARINLATRADAVKAEHSDVPHLILSPKLQGYKFGRFTVMGISRTGSQTGKGARYSCRCRCGAYEVRSHRTIFNYPANADDCCDVCYRAGGDHKADACERFWLWFIKQNQRPDYIGDASRQAIAEVEKRQESPRNYLDRSNRTQDDTKAALDLAFEEFRREYPRLDKAQKSVAPRPAPPSPAVAHSTTSGAYLRKMKKLKRSSLAPKGRLWRESTANIRTLRNED